MIKTILVPFGGQDDNPVALDTALMLAKSLDAHVEAFHTAVDSSEAVAFIGEGMTSAMIENLIEIAEEENRQRATRAEKLFHDCAARHQATHLLPSEMTGDAAFSAGLNIQKGREDDLVALHGRIFDMIVARKPRNGNDPSSHLTLEAALRETGRPVLIVGENAPATLGRNIVIAWNGSVESSRAMALAMPLLKRAEAVTLLSVDLGREGDFTGSEGVEYLAWHGVKARSVDVESGGGSTAQALLDETEKARADLLLMGAYTHSRLRRLFFGAVTGEVIEKCPIPALMAH